MEQQAQDRIHRLGQYKPIHVTRFVIAGSIEERILKLQVIVHLPAHIKVSSVHNAPYAVHSAMCDSKSFVCVLPYQP